LHLAQQIERQNPELALKLGRESLERGYSNELFQLFRIEYLLATSNRIGARNSKASLKLLDRANELVNTMRVDKEQTGSQIELAGMYSLEKSNRGFQIIESLLPKLNELVTAAVKLDGYDNEYLREGEWNMTVAGGVGDLLTRLAQNAGYLSLTLHKDSILNVMMSLRVELRRQLNYGVS